MIALKDFVVHAGICTYSPRNHPTNLIRKPDAYDSIGLFKLLPDIQIFVKPHAKDACCVPRQVSAKLTEHRRASRRIRTT